MLYDTSGSLRHAERIVAATRNPPRGVRGSGFVVGIDTALLVRAAVELAAEFTVLVLLACLPPNAAVAANSTQSGRDKLTEHHGSYVLNRSFEDLYDSAFVLTNEGKTAPWVVSVSELADSLMKYDVVIFGEVHRHTGAHLQELKLLRALYERQPLWVLSLEHFERDVQGVVDDYLAGRVGEHALIDKGRAWDNYPTSYRPLLTYAREHGLPVIAAEAPGWEIACIGQHGPEILDQFTAAERSWMARDIHVPSDEYREKYLKFQSGSALHGGGGSNTPEAQLKAERSFTAQSARDDTMAESILLAKQRYPDRKILHLTGSFHAEGFLGTVTRLRLRDPKLKIAVIDPLEVANPHAPAFAADQLGDGTALLLLHPSPADFAEGEDQSEFIRGIMAKRRSSACKYSPPEAAQTPEPAAGDAAPPTHP
jgi:uncharacterized iron-regulated protein